MVVGRLDKANVLSLATSSENFPSMAGSNETFSDVPKQSCRGYGQFSHARRCKLLTLPEMVLSRKTWIFIYTCALMMGADAYGKDEYCNMDTFNATCPRDHVILMKTARYGRMQIGRCVKRNLGYVGCSVDVLVYMDRVCSGKRHCEVSIPNPTLFATQPCPEDTTPYLEATFDCIPVATGSQQTCNREKRLIINAGSGYIASTVTKEGGYGSVVCPWLIRARPGQRISLSLLNLYRSGESFQLMPGFEGTLGRQDVCYEFALLRDGGPGKSLTSCGSENRVTNIHLSQSNEIEIKFVNPNVLETLGTYLLKYEAIGCPQLVVPKNGWARVDGNTAVIRCNFTDETWYLTCKGTTWLGQTGNCSQDNPQWRFGTILGDGTSFPYGILIVVAIGVALGVFFGGVLLTVVVVYMRRRQRQHHGPETMGDEQEDKTMRASKFIEEDRVGWEQHKYRPTLVEDTYPRDATSSFSTVGRDSGFAGSTYKTPTEDSSIYYERDVNVRSAPGTLRQHIYESPQFS